MSPSRIPHNRKRLVDHVRDGTFRRSRHELMLEVDFSILDVLETFDAGKTKLAPTERLQLEWAWDWQASLQERTAHPDVCWHYFARVARGEHPQTLPPGVNEDDA